MEYWSRINTAPLLDGVKERILRTNNRDRILHSLSIQRESVYALRQHATVYYARKNSR